jgi:CheY-like chemotaxis protein
MRNENTIDHSDVLVGMAPIVTNLLVVDDDPIQRRVIGKIGQQAGHTVLAAATLDQAMDILRGEEIDCATIDLGLGEKNGADLLKFISGMGRNIETLVISGSSERVLEQTRLQAEQAGLEIFALFPKPLDLASLRQSLARAREAVWIRRHDEKGAGRFGEIGSGRQGP